MRKATLLARLAAPRALAPGAGGGSAGEAFAFFCFLRATLRILVQRARPCFGRASSTWLLPSSTHARHAIFNGF